MRWDVWFHRPMHPDRRVTVEASDPPGAVVRARAQIDEPWAWGVSRVVRAD